MVNSLYVYVDGGLVLSGDANGVLKTWDLRTGWLKSLLGGLSNTPAAFNILTHNNPQQNRHSDTFRALH